MIISQKGLIFDWTPASTNDIDGTKVGQKFSNFTRIGFFLESKRIREYDEGGFNVVRQTLQVTYITKAISPRKYLFIPATRELYKMKSISRQQSYSTTVRNRAVCELDIITTNDLVFSKDYLMEVWENISKGVAHG